MVRNLLHKLIVVLGLTLWLGLFSFDAVASSTPERTAVNFITAYFNSDLNSVFKEVQFSKKSLKDPEKSRQRLIAWTKMSKDECLESGGLANVKTELKQNPSLVEKGETLNMGVRIYFKNGNTEFSNILLINLGDEWRVLF